MKKTTLSKRCGRVRGGREDAGGQFVCECIVLHPYETRGEWTCPSVLTSCFLFFFFFWERAKENYWTISDFYKSLFSSPHQVVESDRVKNIISRHSFFGRTFQGACFHCWQSPSLVCNVLTVTVLWATTGYPLFCLLQFPAGMSAAEASDTATWPLKIPRALRCWCRLCLQVMMQALAPASLAWQVPPCVLVDLLIKLFLQ